MTFLVYWYSKEKKKYENHEFQHLAYIFKGI